MTPQFPGWWDIVIVFNLTSYLHSSIFLNHSSEWSSNTILIAYLNRVPWRQMLTLSVIWESSISKSGKSRKQEEEQGKEGGQARLQDKSISTEGNTASQMQGPLETVEVRPLKVCL